MSVVVTGATGHLGRLVVEELLGRGVPAAEIVATGRRVEALADLAERGVDVRRADFEDADSLAAAFAGATAVLIVSSSEVGKRVAQHAAAAQAAKAAGANVLAYTSIVHADDSPLLALGAEHKASEEAISAVGVPVVFLRNSWYFENYTGQLPGFLARGIAGAAGEGRISAAARSDYAAAAAAVLVAARDGAELPAPGGKGTVSPTAGTLVYELGGDEAFTLAELAEVVTKVTGTEVTYTDLPEDAFAAALVQAGLPEPFAQVLAGSDTGAKAGGLFTDSGDLARLAGRPLTTLEDAVRTAL